MRGRETERMKRLRTTLLRVLIRLYECGGSRPHLPWLLECRLFAVPSAYPAARHALAVSMRTGYIMQQFSLPSVLQHTCPCCFKGNGNITCKSVRYPNHLKHRTSHDQIMQSHLLYICCWVSRREALTMEQMLREYDHIHVQTPASGWLATHECSFQPSFFLSRMSPHG